MLDFSKAGILRFEGDADGCLNGLVVAQLSYRLDTAQEIKEQPNDFIVNARRPNRWSLQVRKKIVM